MAVDTRNKRASALGVALPFAVALPAPDASVATEDRPHVAFSYSGLTVAAVVQFAHACVTRITNLVPVRALTSLMPRRRVADLSPTRALNCLED